MSKGRLIRGEVAGYRWGELATGVVNAAILARSIPDPDLESRPLAILREGVVSPESVRHWADLSRTWSPIDVTDLTE
jgi:hypothetical protein